MSSVSLSKIGPAKQSRNVCARNRVFSCHVVSHSRFWRTTAAFDDVDVFLALAFGPPADAAARMEKLLVMLAEIWPATAGRLFPGYIRFVLQQESQSGEPYWPHVLNLRCIAEQQRFGARTATIEKDG